MSSNAEKEQDRSKQDWIQEQQEFFQKFKEKEKLLQDQLFESKQKEQELSKLYQNAQNELFAVKSTIEDKQSAQQSQADLLQDDISTLNAKVLRLETERVCLVCS